MKTILGLDIGTNSIGWALVKEGHSLLDAGSRIFPIGVNGSFEDGTDESKNADRRTARMMRRRLHRYKLRRAQLIAALNALGMYPLSPLKEAPELFRLRKLALDQQIHPEDIGRILLILNKRRGFKSNKRAERGESKKDEDTGTVKKGILELKEQIEANGCRTVGEYFYSLFEQGGVGVNPIEPIERIRSRWVSRDMYEHEFDMIWEKQREFYPELLTPANKTLIRDQIIFYQRPLKSQRATIGKCRFEPLRKVCPKSHWLFQEFRIWQQVNHLKVTDPAAGRYDDFLTQEEKEGLVDFLMERESATQDQARKAAGLPRSAVFSDIGDKLPGNKTHNRMQKALGSYWSVLLDSEDPQQIDDRKHRLWHTLHFFDNEEKLARHAEEKLGLPPDVALKYAATNLEDGYASMSLFAIKKVLAFLRQGQTYADACKSAGYHHSYDQETQSKNRPLSELIKPLRPFEIRNPVVQQACGEAIRLVNAIMKQYGKPDEIRIELPREVKKPKKVRQEITFRNRKRANERIEFRDIISQHIKRPPEAVADLDVQKYELWREANGCCPYTGDVIGIEQLFTAQIEIEHIWPYSKTMDNSMVNKTVTFRKVNLEKGDRIPFDYFNSKPGNSWQEYQERISRTFSKNKGKRDRLLAKKIPDEFLSNQLNNTAYIAKEVRRKMDEICHNVYISNGVATADLRRQWGLNEILNPNDENFKSRDDHRHHAVDAIVIACTSNRFIQLLSSNSKFDYRGRLRTPELPEPWPGFRDDVVSKIEGLLVSHRSSKRLMTSRINKIRVNPANHGGEKLLLQRVKGVRGPLHEESLYGKIKNPHQQGEETFVIRKPLSWFNAAGKVDRKKIQKVIDPAIRKLMLARADQFNDKFGDAFGNPEEPFRMPVKNGKAEGPEIKSLRVDSRANNLAVLRPGENDRLFVDSGNNFLIAIYESENGKRTYRTLPFLEAVQARMKGEPLVPGIIEEEKKGVITRFKLLFTLKQNDALLWYGDHPDNIRWDNPAYLVQNLYVVRKFDVNGNIGLVRHSFSRSTQYLKIDTAPGHAKMQVCSSLNAVKVRIDLLGRVHPIA